MGRNRQEKKKVVKPKAETDGDNDDKKNNKEVNIFYQTPGTELIGEILKYKDSQKEVNHHEVINTFYIYKIINCY